ncbi:MAG: hypothetical protein SFX18_14075 [Pirellulales bacterium]|nr:hypothetical protein [Pirellulales bacterium]
MRIPFLPWSLLCAATLLAQNITATVNADEAPPTFNKDIAPLLFQHCAACHRPDNVGPFSLLTYADAKKRANQLAEITKRQIMPPWMPHADWGNFKNDRSLTEAQIAKFVAWASVGAPEGEATDLPPQPKYPTGWQNGEPDLILALPQPFTVPAEGRDVYHHFVFPLKLKKQTYLKGIEVLPGNRRVTHHAVGILDTSGTARRRAKKHDGQGYPGNDPGFLPAGFTPGYAPGQGANFFAPDEALTLKPGTDLVLQMHYSPSGKEETDQTKVGLYFTDKAPPRNLGVLLLGSSEIDIPPGEAAYKRTDKFILPADYEIRSIWAHLHLIGKEVKVWAELPNKTTRNLLFIPDWDFNWQDTYHYQRRFILPRGTVIRAEFVWDNSADNPRNPHNPPVRVLHGEQSADEMAGIILGGRPVREWDEIGTWIAVLAHFLEVESKSTKRK